MPKEELFESGKQTGAKAISELRKLERRNSLDEEVRIAPPDICVCVCVCGLAQTPVTHSFALNSTTGTLQAAESKN